MSSTPVDVDNSGDMANRSHATNLSLTPYDDGTGDRKNMQVFAVESLKKVGTSVKRLAAIETADPNTLPSLLPLIEELEFDPEDKDITTVVWVGMLLSSADLLKKKTTMIGGRSCSLDSADNAMLVKTDPQAMRVVCPRGRGTAVYYALVSQHPVTKLCTGVMTVIDSVFFFPEFRDDDLNSIQKRRDTWAAKIREACGKSDKTKGNAKRTLDEAELFDESQSSSSADVTGLE
jgi:hypothetical protein